MDSQQRSERYASEDGQGRAPVRGETPPAEEGRKQTSSKGRRFQPFRRIGAYGLLAIALLPTFVLLILVYRHIETGLLDIRTASVKASKVHLPGILNRQRALINIESLRRYVETVYNAFDPVVRREALINALALATESVFEPDSRFGDSSSSSTTRIRSLGDVKRRSDDVAAEQHEAEARFTASLARLEMLAAANPEIAILAEQSRVLADWVRLWPATWERQEALPVLESVFGFCGNQLDGALGTDEHPADSTVLVCKQLRDSWRDMESAQRKHMNDDAEAHQLWMQIDETLRKLSDLMSSEEAELIFLAMEHIYDETGRTQTSFYMSCALLLLILCVFGLVLHRFILSPLALVSRSLQHIRDGGTLDPLPPVRVRELQDMLNILPVLSSHVSELSARSDLLEREKNRFRNLSLVDGLTGVGNRRYFDACLADVEAGAPVALLMIDVDLFKAYNDTYGHQAGDGVLIAIAQAMCTAMLRSTDQVFRYGGEEFCVLLVDATEKAALVVGERLRQHILKLEIPHKSSSVAPFVTVSIGMAFRPNHDSAVALIEQADHALYEAKAQGRNRLCSGGVLPAPADTEEDGTPFFGA